MFRVFKQHIGNIFVSIRKSYGQKLTLSVYIKQNTEVEALESNGLSPVSTLLLIIHRNVDVLVMRS